ncbi:MAG: hypothetical protein DMD60_12600 [Gemmatimonadetes bacterium]|nr:MAG: hypothetical protein DMD60_12600 [Gemmatimonadota bacterium]
MYSNAESAPRSVPLRRVARAVVARLRRVRAHPVLNATAFEESWRERAGHAVDPDHRPHIVAALDWLGHAQDATSEGGIARGYSLGWNPLFASRAWQPADPGATGDIIPLLYGAARQVRHRGLAERAERAARWELELQLPSGAVRGGVQGDRAVPAVFNTGRVLLAWLAAFQETGAGVFAGAARRAACFLLATLGEDGVWRPGEGGSAEARRHAALYNARTAWALAEAGRRLGAPEFRAAAARALRAVARRQHDDGWMPDCCFTDPVRPLLHTVAAAIAGLLEGGAVLRDERLIARAASAAERVACAVDPGGRLPGRFAIGWRPAASWDSLVGAAQMANVWLRLYELTRERQWLDPVDVVLRFLKSTQNRATQDPGVRGGLKASFPVGAECDAYQVSSAATAGFADSLIRDERRRAGVSPLTAAGAA